MSLRLYGERVASIRGDADRQQNRWIVDQVTAWRGAPPTSESVREVLGQDTVPFFLASLKAGKVPGRTLKLIAAASSEREAFGNTSLAVPCAVATGTPLPPALLKILKNTSDEIMFSLVLDFVTSNIPVKGHQIPIFATLIDAWTGENEAGNAGDWIDLLGIRIL